MERNELPVAVLGSGPVGLAAAAHLHERGIPAVIFERGHEAAASIRSWSHVQLFSPWRFDIDAAAQRLLESTGWEPPDPDEHPTGGELVDRYLAPLAAVPAIGAALRTGHLVVAVTRDGFDKVRSEGRGDAPLLVTTLSRAGIERTAVRAVIDATGTWLRPNPLGADGRPAIGEGDAAERITRGIPDVAGADSRRYAGHRVAVVGSGHSAQNAVRDLAALASSAPGTEITWVIRRPDAGQMFGGKADDQLPERGRLGADAQSLVDAGTVGLVTGFRVGEVRPVAGGVLLLDASGRAVGPFDEIVAATGFRPDLEFLSELRVDVDPALDSSRSLAALIDPNVHSCGSVPPHGAVELAHPEPGLYLVGAKSYGRAPTFLLATGYEQVRSVAAELAGDHAAARDVRLVLPETGVCSVGAPAAASCCG